VAGVLESPTQKSARLFMHPAGCVYWTDNASFKWEVWRLRGRLDSPGKAYSHDWASVTRPQLLARLRGCRRPGGTQLILVAHYDTKARPCAGRANRPFCHWHWGSALFAGLVLADPPTFRWSGRSDRRCNLHPGVFLMVLKPGNASPEPSTMLPGWVLCSTWRRRSRATRGMPQLASPS